jgi:hypothetical protein
MPKLAREAHNPWRLALTRLISALPLAIAPALTSARACNIEVEASLWENTAACQLLSDFMQRVSDLSPHNPQAAAKCIDLKQGQREYVESAPLGDFLCVRPLDESFCYWAYTNTVMPDTTPTR